jgi:hypothetical protein
LKKISQSRLLLSTALLKTHERLRKKTNYTASANKLKARWIYPKKKSEPFENRIRKTSFLDHKLKCNVGEFFLAAADRLRGSKKKRLPDVFRSFVRVN